jgi:DNA repair protein RadA/Sms
MKLKTARGFNFGTNINDIVVPDILRQKINTGRDYTNVAWGGKGITPTSVTLFTGGPGAGKTTMMLGLVDSINSSETIAVFNSGEESLYQVKMTVERLGLKSGFPVGEETNVPLLLQKCDKIRERFPNRKFVLVIDSLQTMNDAKYEDGTTNSKTPERVLELITDWCKETFSSAVIIGQVGKDGKFIGKNTLKHMVDAHLELSIEDDQKSELFGCRLLEMTKSRFGGAGVQQYLELKNNGFKVVATVGQV